MTIETSPDHMFYSVLTAIQSNATDTLDLASQLVAAIQWPQQCAKVHAMQKWPSDPIGGAIASLSQPDGDDQKTIIVKLHGPDETTRPGNTLTMITVDYFDTTLSHHQEAQFVTMSDEASAKRFADWFATLIEQQRPQ